MTFTVSTSLFFVLLPQLSCGLLSDFKICGDSECESLMSRVRAVRDHHGKDCRFLSFRQGETIFVYHKLTGKRSNLWAGSMNKQFGYFPKEAVKEEQNFATKEIVVVTQESDFLCIDDFGYPIDSSHLNTDDDEDDESGPKKPEELETRHKNSYSDNTNAGNPSPSKDSSSESYSTSREDIENRDNGAAKTKQESPETAVELKEKGGSPASSWLSSSVTEWLGVGQQEQPENSAEVHEKHLMQGEDLLTSSVMGWLGLRSEEKSVSAKDNANHEEQDRKALESSTITGWLGFGGDEKADSSVGKENDDERGLDMETAAGENFRSRKMYLDIETQPIQEKKINDMGTLGWLGNGLSRTLGFGLNDQDTRETIQVSTGEVEKDVKQTATSWFDLGISSILAFRKDNNQGDRTESHTESDNIVQGHVDSNNNIRDTAAYNKDSELDDTSEVDQNYNPPQNQREDINLVPNGKEGKNKFEILGSKNDVTSMPVLPYMESRSVEQSVSETDSKRDTNGEASLHEFTNQVGNVVDKSNMSCGYGASEEECKRERRDEDILMLYESAEQSQGQESGSSLASETEVKESEEDDKQKEVHNKEKDEDIDEQNSVEDNQEDIEEVAEKEELKEKSQEEFKEGATQESWNITDDNTQEDKPLEFGSDHLKKRDPEMMHENLSEEDKRKHSFQGSAQSQDAKGTDLQGTFISVMNFLKESTFVPSHSPQKEERESKEDEGHKELDDEEKRDKIQIEEQVDSQVLIVERKEIVERQEKQQEELPSREKRATLEGLDVKTPEELTEMEQLQNKKQEEFTEEDKQDDVEALNTKKEGVQDFMQKEKGEEFEDEKQEGFEQWEKQEEMEMLVEKSHEVDDEREEKKQKKLFEKELDYLKWGMFEEQDKPTNIEKLDEKKHGKLKDFKQNREVEGFENEKQGGFERGEKSEMLDALEEKMREVVEEVKEEKEEEYEDGQKKHEVEKLEEAKYEVSGESEEEFEDDKKEEFEDREEEGVEKLEETKHKVDGESEGLEDKRQEELEHKEQEEGKKFKEYEVDGQEGTREKLAQVKEEEKQEFHGDLKVSEDMQKASDFVDSKNVNEEMESLERMDKLCTQFEQDEIMREREGRSFDDGLNLLYDASTLTSTTKSNEMSKPQPIQSPEHELDSTINSDQDLQTNLQPPSPSLIHKSHSNYLPPNTAKPHQPTTLSKNYKTLQDHMSTEEITILAELFGKKKFKLLDYILGHVDVFTDDRDESILMEIETILHCHREKLFPPSMRLSDAPGEDKEKTRTIIAIQKLEMLLTRARDTFYTRKSDINRANAQAKPRGIGASCSTNCKDKKTMEIVGVMVEKQNDGSPEKNKEDDNERGSEEMSLVEKVNKLSHSQTVPPQLLESMAGTLSCLSHNLLYSKGLNRYSRPGVANFLEDENYFLGTD